MKNLLKILLILLPVFSLAQENDSAAYKRERYLFIQRGSPYDSVPQDAFRNALIEKSNLSPLGYYLQDEQWINLGPAPVVGVEKYSGRINTVKYLNSNTVFIGAAEGGVWKSDNFSVLGATWQNMSGELKSLSSGALAIDRQNNIIYYATGEGNYGFLYSYLGLGLFKSTNYGINWIHIDEESGLPEGAKYFRLVIRPGYNNHIFAVTNKGLYRSINSGLNWNVVQGTEGLQCNDLVFSNTNNLYAYLVGPKNSSNGVSYKRSYNGGESFIEPDLPTGLQIEQRTHISICETNNNIIYIVTDLNGSIKVFKSENGGSSFILKQTIQINTYLGYCLFIKVKPDNENRCFIGAQGLLETSDGWNTYCKRAGLPGLIEPCQTYAFMHADYHELDFNPSNSNEMVIATDGGPYFSTNGGLSWYSLNDDNGFSITQVYRIGSRDYYNIFGGLQDEGICKKNNAYEWNILQQGDGTGIFASQNSYIWFGFMGNIGTFYKNGDPVTQNFGNTWDGGNDWIGAFAENLTIPGTFYTARRHTTGNLTVINFWRTTDYGNYWGEQVYSQIQSSFSPQNIEASQKNPQIIYLNTSGYIGPENNLIFGRELYKSTNGGFSWGSQPLITKDDEYPPKRYITRVVTSYQANPELEDEVFITLSSFNMPGQYGHIFKSTNGGSNWIDVTGNLPNIPVNDLIIWYSDCNTRNLICATDIGVFISTNEGATWQELSANLPKTIIMDLEYLPFNGKLRCATFGRGVWEVNLPSNLYIKGNLTINRDTSPDGDLIVCSGSHLTVNANLFFKPGKKLIVEDGAILDADGISLSNQASGNWGGIEFNGNAYGNINNCYIYASTTPITLNGCSGDCNTINITNCALNAYDVGPIQINNRNNVNIDNCTWEYSTTNSPFVCAIEVNGSDNIYITNNKVNLNENLLDKCAISITYGDNIILSNNQIKKTSIGISVNNSSPVIIDNEITSDNNQLSAVGIGFTNSYASTVTKNIITGYQTGFDLYNSSPIMSENVVTYIGEVWTDDKASLKAIYNSTPRLKPTQEGQNTIWDAGLNILRYNQTPSSFYGTAVRVGYYSIPELDYGCNTIGAIQYYTDGCVECQPGSEYVYFMRGNIWEAEFNPSKFNIYDADEIYDPVGCENPGGGSGKEISDPPAPIIIDYGHGITDTIEVTIRNISLSQDQVLYMSALKNELNRNFTEAIIKYKQIVSTYRDSITAIYSLKRVINCYDRINSDSSSYNLLRNYYLNLSQQYSYDTSFRQVTEELAVKVLTRLGQYSYAITEYEDIILRTTDTLEILCAELNIIETYMIMQNNTGGNAPSFTGRIQKLKPLNRTDGIRMITEKLYGIKNLKQLKQIPNYFLIEQNYPNPFNPVTNIKYCLPRREKVTIKVYDLLGKMVKELVNEFKEPGYYEVKFDGSDLSSGVYIYRIETESYTNSKKMILLK